MLKVTSPKFRAPCSNSSAFQPAQLANLLKGTCGTFTNNNPFAINPTLTATSLTLTGRRLCNLGDLAGVRTLQRRARARGALGYSGFRRNGESHGWRRNRGACPGKLYNVRRGRRGRCCTPGITFKPYGVGLSFTPVVQAEGRIQIHLTTEVTEVDLANTMSYLNVAVPGFKTRKNETTVEPPSGGSMATAGLLTQNTGQAINGIPGLINPAGSRQRFSAHATISARRPK